MSNTLLFCVDCRQQIVPATSREPRCPECLAAFRAKGGITKEIAPIVKRGGITTGGHTIFHNFAKWCRNCGRRLGDAHYNSRVLYALKKGGECLTCEDCFIKRRWG